jgi:hypothetical protein
MPLVGRQVFLFHFAARIIFGGAITAAGIKFRQRLLERLSQPSVSVTGLSLADKKSLRRIVKQMVALGEELQGEPASVLRIRKRSA